MCGSASQTKKPNSFIDEMSSPLANRSKTTFVSGLLEKVVASH